MDKDILKEIKMKFSNKTKSFVPKDSKSKKKLIVWIVIIAAAAYIVWSSVYTVNDQERAVITTFGSVTGTADAGIHFLVPFGVQQAHIVEVNAIKRIEIGYRTTDDGSTAVAYTVEDASHPMDLYVRAVDGKSDAVALGSEVKRYFCDPDGELVFFDAICRDSGEAVMQSYVATASGEVEPLSDGRGMLLSAYRDTAYYLQYDSEERAALYRYDGQERRLLCSDVDHRYVYGSALDQVALYMDRTDGQWYCALGDQEGVPFRFDSGEQTWRYVGMFGGGTAIALWSEDALVALRLSDGQVTAVDVLASDPSYYPRIQSCGDFCFSADEHTPEDRYGISLSDLTVCRDGETICLAEDVEVYRTALYAGDEILTLDSLNGFALVQIQDGARQTLAENVSYYLRLNGGQILYLSDGGLFLYDGASTLLSEDALQVFCAGGQYNTGAVSLYLPEFGDGQ